jgi:hypothetical protein
MDHHGQNSIGNWFARSTRVAVLGLPRMSGARRWVRAWSRRTARWFLVVTMPWSASAPTSVCWRMARSGDEPGGFNAVSAAAAAVVSGWVRMVMPTVAARAVNAARGGQLRPGSLPSDCGRR